MLLLHDAGHRSIDCLHVELRNCQPCLFHAVPSSGSPPGRQPPSPVRSLGAPGGSIGSPPPRRGSEDDLAELLPKTPPPIRPVGTGHSFTSLVPTDGTLVSLDQMSGIVSHDAANNMATVWAGTRLGD